MFTSECKKGNIVSCYKKGDRQNLKVYRPVSPLSICGKIFNRLIFNEMFSFFLANNILAPNQSGFKSDHSFINQPLLIIHEFIHLLMMDLKLKVFSWIYLKPWINSGMKGLYSNLSKAVFRMTC